MLSVKKKWKIIGIILLIIIIMVNALWFFTSYCPYLQDRKGMEKDPLGDYCYEEDGYAFYAYAPHYLKHSYNISIGKANETKGSIDVSFLVWPLADSNEKYGVLLTPAEDDKGAVEIYVDERLNAINDITQYEKELFSSQSGEINKLYGLYKAKFQ